MKDVIIQGLTQAYSNLVHMFAEFLPRLLVMLVIVVMVKDTILLRCDQTFTD